MNLNQRERLLLVSTVVVLLGLGNWLLLSPLVRSWRELGQQVQAQRELLARHQGKIDRMPTWQAEYDTLRSELGQQIEQFDQTSQVLQKVEEVAEAAGVVIVSRRPKTPLERGVYRELPVDCRVEANTESLVRFLYALRTSSGFINVEQLQIAPQPSRPNVLRCDLVIHALSGKSGRTAL
ncbi:type 4a pilus biogenesis protein PilO [bacterium]|nr:type 4a pilus biogenesis protein PilO [bacterium]